jgi:hypothetical protein
MAIKKFINSTPTDLTGLASWLTANKDGTFLENFQFVDESTSNPTGHKLTMSTTGVSCIIRVYTYVIGPTTQFICRLNNGTNYDTLVLANEKSYNAATFAKVKQVYLCKYGLIVMMECPTCYNEDTRSTPTAQTSPILLTVDNNNDIVCIGPFISPFCGNLNNCNHMSDSGTRLDVSGYSIINTTGDSIIRVPVKPNGLSSYGTMLQNFAGYDTSGNGYYTPFAYYATSTQFTPNDCSALGVVEMNNKRYITNGRWYVQDAD